MARRTRKDKIKAKHIFSVKTEQSTSEANFSNNVKSQILQDQIGLSKKVSGTKKADPKAKDFISQSQGKDILRSVFIAASILALEVVLYFVLNLN